MDSDGPRPSAEMQSSAPLTQISASSLKKKAPSPTPAAPKLVNPPLGTNLSKFDKGFGGAGVNGDYRTNPRDLAWLDEVRAPSGPELPYPDGKAGADKTPAATIRKIREDVGYLYTLPEVKALLDVFSFTEVTWKDGYLTSHYPKPPFGDMNEFHGTDPNGRYQITQKNWKNYGEGWWQRKDFSEISQDLVIITLLRQNRVIEALETRNLSVAFSRAARLFASIPMSLEKDYSAYVKGKYSKDYDPKTQIDRQPTPVR
jgi:hypothetical protein